jgi:hypothetical protein
MIGRPGAARTLGEARFRARERTQPASVERTRLPFFSRNLFHHVDLEVALGHQLLELGVLLLELPKPLHVDRLQLAESLAPGVDRLLADAVLLGHLRHRTLVRLAQDLDHLLFAEPTLLHGFLHPGSHSLRFQSVRGSQGRSNPVLIGESKFHISCSDDNMNGVEDCEKPEGDGKSDDPGFVNDWLLEGMSGDQALVCTPGEDIVPPVCGFGPELILVMPGLFWLHRRRLRKAA